jgi:hypothetical protein
MDATARPDGGITLAARIVAALRSETRLVRLALAVVALHVVDDNFLQPAPGTSAGDHLVSGLVPLAILAAVAWLYPRPRAGIRAATAMTFGALGLTVGGPAAYFVFEGAAADCQSFATMRWRSPRRSARTG